MRAPFAALLPAAALMAAMVPVAECRAAGAAAAAERRLTIFYTGEIHGTLEPCGCTSDPLGDIARYAMLVREAAKNGGAVLVLDGGGLSFPETSTKKSQLTDAMRARFLATELVKLGPFAAGLAETDVRGGAADVVPPRLAVNLPPSPALAPSLLKTVGGVRVGVFGVADPELGAKLGGKGEDPIAAGKKEVARLRQAGAELVVALAAIDKPAARRLARDAGADLVVLGRQVGHGMARAEPVGRGFMVAAADEIQRVGRIDIVLARGGTAHRRRRSGGDARSAGSRSTRPSRASTRSSRPGPQRRAAAIRRSSPASGASATPCSPSAAGWTRRGRRPRRATTSPTG